ncbi:hypothetical protein [Succinivibrio dextrinosolvens]|uniref:Uncharacterized protein n=1 Tax=Succinivibrio dextrinosolvens TaxID=83771 RepID=A0A662ZF92_9GAMM|nr:hypothetical protein [Succinivibrio dextrinosolvens]SFK59988.1 hypothetical protein SAMN04487865_11341 [Succinivibrio dextrinosolvens]
MYMLAARTWLQADQITRLEKANTELYNFIATETLVEEDCEKLKKLKSHLIAKYKIEK